MKKIKDFEEFLKNVQILIVDDIPENLQVLGNVIRDNHLKFAFALDGFQAIKSAEAIHPDLILLDINMPEMNGFECARVVKETPGLSDIPIIFITARSDTEDIVEGFKSGGVDYITKPFETEELIARIFTHLELKFSRDQIKEQNENLTRFQEKIVNDSRRIISLNEKLAESELKLKKSNEDKDHFLSIIAHGLRSPLSGLKSLIELLTLYYDKLSAEEVKNMVINMDISAGKVFELLENLLQWSKIQSDSIELEMMINDLLPIIDKNIKLMRFAAEKKNITINTNLPEQANAYFDKIQINNVLRNLISNAINFNIEHGKIDIKLTESDTHFVFEIKDTGIGISKEDIEKLFKIEINPNSIGKSGEKGSGLGLILCYEYLKKHGHEIEVESESGIGSTFKFRLNKYKY